MLDAMFTKTEQQVFGYIACGYFAFNFIALLMFILFAKLPDSAFKEKIKDIITALDDFADEMENTEKRRRAVDQINELLGWRRILIPRLIIGWIIDLQVGAIRRMQKSANIPNTPVEGSEQKTDSEV